MLIKESKSIKKKESNLNHPIYIEKKVEEVKKSNIKPLFQEEKKVEKIEKVKESNLRPIEYEEKKI